MNLYLLTDLASKVLGFGANGGVKVMDIQSRLHGRLFSKGKCDAFVAGAFAGGKNLMRPAWHPSDPEDVHRGLQNPSPPRASHFFGSCVRRRITLLVGLIQLLLTIVNPSSAASITFQNCLSPDIINNNATLQFIPMVANAVFNATTSSHNLNVTVYGNITGSLSSNQNWPNDNTNQSDEEIPDVFPGGLRTRLKATFQVLSYILPTVPQSAPFCDSTLNGKCPLAPATG